MRLISYEISIDLDSFIERNFKIDAGEEDRKITICCSKQIYNNVVTEHIFAIAQHFYNKQIDRLRFYTDKDFRAEILTAQYLNPDY